LTGFLAAADSGDLSGLLELLAEDVVVWNDGGGRVRAALRPIMGAQRVAAFVTGLVHRFGGTEAQLLDINGQPAVRTQIAGQEQGRR
jgi:RNA polymerase sigma-70 factor (ECF subfamily)